MANYTNRYKFALQREKQAMTKAEKTRSFIIEKTAAIFNKKGYAGTSLSDLTEATGLTKGALYGNFKNKDEIALAAYDYNLRWVRANFEMLADHSKTAIERLLAIPEFYEKNFAAICQRGGCPILNTAVEADDNQPLLKKKVNKTIEGWKKNLSATINEGIENGEIKPGTDATKYACLLIALFEGGLTLSKSSGDLSFVNHALARMRELINVEMKK